MGDIGNSPGTFIRIRLSDGSFGYGRLLEWPYVAFYAHHTTTPDPDLDRIASKPVLFRIAVRMHLAPTSWENIGYRELDAILREPIVQFTQDIGNPNRCVIFDTAGNERVAEARECSGLERASAWEPWHVEERLLDRFTGRPNAAEEHSRARLLMADKRGNSR